MNRTLLVSGCSITHGAELHNGFMSSENVKKSFSAILAERLNLDLVNVALSGSSNEYIFHSIIEELDKHENLSSVIVVWTSHSRLHWKSKDRHWFFLPTWASSMEDLENFEMHDKVVNGVWYTGDSAEILEELEKHHKFFVLNYLDSKNLESKLLHYRLALKSICEVRKINLIDLSIMDLPTVKECIYKGRHPNEKEHKLIADFIFSKYFSEQIKFD